jgi:ACS family pantothenate transporter-like MFS transporter
MAWIPLVWFQQVHQPFVTPGNRAAAVVAGFNVIVFGTITLLAHREKLAKKRKNQLPLTPDSSQPVTPIDEAMSKNVAVDVVSLPSDAVEPSKRSI